MEEIDTRIRQKKINKNYKNRKAVALQVIVTQKVVLFL